jgi:hypothetical protein
MMVSPCDEIVGAIHMPVKTQQITAAPTSMALRLTIRQIGIYLTK